MAKLNSLLKVAATCVALLSFTFILSGCTKSNPAGPSPSNSEIVPLTMGNAWTYRSIIYSPADSVLGDGPLSILVNRDTTISGIHLFSFWGWAAEGDSGLTTYTDGHFTLYLKYPIDKGATYYASGWGFTVLVSTIDTTITVPAGSFNCIDYQFYAQGYLDAEYFACPRVGVVKEVFYFGSNYPPAASVIQNVQILTSYTVK